MPSALQQVNDDKVAFGLASKLGTAGAVTGFIMALIAFIGGDRSEETIGPLVVGGLLLYAVVDGRMKQRAAKTIAAGQVAAAQINNN